MKDSWRYKTMSGGSCGPGSKILRPGPLAPESQTCLSVTRKRHLTYCWCQGATCRFLTSRNWSDIHALSLSCRMGSYHWSESIAVIHILFSQLIHLLPPSFNKVTLPIHLWTCPCHWLGRLLNKIRVNVTFAIKSVPRATKYWQKWS